MQRTNRGVPLMVIVRDAHGDTPTVLTAGQEQWVQVLSHCGISQTESEQLARRVSEHKQGMPILYAPDVTADDLVISKDGANSWNRVRVKCQRWRLEVCTNGFARHASGLCGPAGSTEASQSNESEDRCESHVCTAAVHSVPVLAGGCKRGKAGSAGKP